MPSTHESRSVLNQSINQGLHDLTEAFEWSSSALLDMLRQNLDQSIVSTAASRERGTHQTEDFLYRRWSVLVLSSDNHDDVTELVQMRVVILTTCGHMHREPELFNCLDREVLRAVSAPEAYEKARTGGRTLMPSSSSSTRQTSLRAM
jgi:hypothetical protein